MSTKTAIKGNILLTSGRAPVTLELARLFSNSGYRVYVAESLTNHPCRFSTKVQHNFLVPAPNHNPAGYRDALIKIMNCCKIDWLIPTCEEIFHIARWKREIESNCDGKIFCTELDTLIQLHHKYDFIKLAESWGFNVPKTFMAGSNSEIINYQREMGAPAVIKPAFSRFGTKVRYLPAQAAIIPQIEISPTNPWVIQQQIFGNLFCTYSIVREGKITAHATYPMGCTIKGGASIDFAAVDHPAIFNFVSQFVKKALFTGQIAFDIIEDASGELFPIECNPRATSGIHLLARQPLFAEAFFGSSTETVLPSPGTKAMFLIPMLNFGIKSLFKPSSFKQWFNTFCSSHDVIWDFSDPIPFLQQLTVLLGFWRIGRINKLSLIEASTLDIEWNGK